MVSRTWLLSGIPRSGTSLCCRLAGELPDIVALSEPMRRQAFAGVSKPCKACLCIENFVKRERLRIPLEGRAASVQVDGRLDDDRVAAGRLGDGLRKPPGGRGEILIDKPLSSEFTLLIEHNALFAALLPELTASIPCLALVRNPLAVLASWQTVELPVNEGRIPAGEQFDRELRHQLEREPDPLPRQIIVLNWFFDRYHSHLDPGNIVRYEDLVESGGQALFRRIGRANGPPAALMSRNHNRLFAGVQVDRLLAVLVQEGGAWSEFYIVANCNRLADMIFSGR